MKPHRLNYWRLRWHVLVHPSHRIGVLAKHVVRTADPEVEFIACQTCEYGRRDVPVGAFDTGSMIAEGLRVETQRRLEAAAKRGVPVGYTRESSPPTCLTCGAKLRPTGGFHYLCVECRRVKRMKKKHRRAHESQQAAA